MFDNIYCSNRCTALLIMIHDEMVPISIWPWEPSLHAPFWHTARHQEDSRCGARAQTVPRNQLPNWDDSCRIANNNKNNQNVEGRLRGRIKTAFFSPPPASFKDGNMTQTGLTFRLQLTVTAPGMDQNERGMSWWKPGSGQRCNNHTLLFHLCQITVRALAPCEMTGRDKRCLLAWLEENGDEQNRRPHRHLRRRRNADRSVASHRQHNKCPVYSHTDVWVVSEDPQCRLHTCKESCGRTEFHKVITGYSDWLKVNFTLL